MNAILTIAGASIREHSRRKLLLVFAIISLALMMAVVFFLLRTNETGGIFGTRRAIVTIASTSFLQLFALIATLAFSMGNIGQPFANGEAALVLARPVTRAQFALGRYLGSAATIMGFCALLGAETQAARIISGQGVSIDLWGHWATLTFNLLVTAAVTTLLSIAFSTPVIAAVLGYLAFEVITGSALAHGLVRSHRVTGLLAKLLEGVWYVAPKFLTSPLVISTTRNFAGSSPSGLFVPNAPWLVAWASLYLVALLYLIALLVGRKEVS